MNAQVRARSHKEVERLLVACISQLTATKNKLASGSQRENPQVVEQVVRIGAEISAYEDTLLALRGDIVMLRITAHE
jgi:hypothetical protein